MPQRFVPQLGQPRVAAMPWIGQVHVDLRGDLGRALAEYDDALRQEQRLLDVVRDQQGGEPGALPQFD